MTVEDLLWTSSHCLDGGDWTGSGYRECSAERAALITLLESVLCGQAWDLGQRIVGYADLAARYPEHARTYNEEVGALFDLAYSLGLEP